MSSRSYKPCWIRGGRIAEIAWIGKNVLAWCSGLCIIFFQTAEKRQTLRWCASQSTGEGAYCLSGHVSAPIFAFAEKVLNPRILVFAFPSMTKIAECQRGSPDGYLATAFTARDHLVSLGNYPDFKLIIWSWRTGEKIIAVETVIRDEVGQALRITQNGPILVAQMGKTCGKLITWDVHIIGKTAILKDHEIKLPENSPVLCVDWKPDSGDPLLAITDDFGHIYLSNYDGTNVYRIVLSQRCGTCVDLEIPAVCWFRDGIILKTTFCQIRYYTKKQETNSWRKEWYLKSTMKPCIMVSHPSRNDLFYHTLEGHLMQIHFPTDPKNPVVERQLHFGAIYSYVDYVYPWAHHLAATDDLKDLMVIESYGGKEISRISVDFSGDISCQGSHPNYPLIILASTKGELALVSLLNPEEPKIVMNLRLQENPLDLIKFSESGRFAVVAEKKSGTCFCVSILHDKLYTVIAQLEPRKIITDALLYEVQKNLKVFLLCGTFEKYMAGHKFLVYDVSGQKNYLEEPTNVLDIPGIFRNLCHAPGNPQTLIGSAYLTRQLHVMKIQDWKSMVPVEATTTGHQVRLACFFSNDQWISSTAFDGLVIVRDKTLKRVLATVMTHHRHDLGATRAIINPGGDQIVALGSNGSLVAMKKRSADAKVTDGTPSVNEIQDFYKVDFEIYEKRKSQIVSDYGSIDRNIAELLSRSEENEEMQKKLAGKTWIQWREEEKMKEQEKEWAAEKASIRRDFAALKAKLKEMLDENEKCPEMERLPISEFDLDKLSREQKIKAAKDERENLRLQLESNCNAMDRVTNWIKTTFWDKQKVLGRSIFGLYDSVEVTNYPIAHDDDLEEGQQPWADFVKESTRKIVINDTFQPWRPYTDDQLQMELSKRVELQRQDGRQRMDTLLQEEDLEVDLEELEDKRAYEGMTTYQFVEASPHYYSQMESYGYDHVILDNHYLMHDCNKLRAYFNAMFDDVYALKEKEMNAVRERINEIRHIDSELRLMFNQSVPEIPEEPQWHAREKPESIIEVQDHEIKSKPYVSPSQQEILDKQAAEEERIRKEMLADDFRERSLMKMMDGVLEVRWEDTIKIDVPKPPCMLNKKPEQYNAEDIAAVKKYEKDVEFLAEERERYRRMLEADYVKISGLLKQSVDKFNTKLKDLFSLKLQVEAALHQLYLRYARGCLRNYNRMKALNEDDKMNAEITEKRKDATALETKMSTLEEASQSLRVEYDALTNQEKSIAKKFKSEFGSLGRVATDIIARHYKYRPKTNLKQLGSSDFLELGKSVLTRSLPTLLPSECLDYLKNLNTHDARPHNLPESVELKQWDRFVDIRRQKIALELKLKAKLTEIGEAERTIEAFNNSIAKCKDDADAMSERLKKIREDRRMADLDTEIQMVLKMGQIEIDLEGNLEDTADAVFISRSEIERINEKILAAGQKKIDAMNETLNLRRRVLQKEWQHKCLRLKLKEAREDLQYVRSIVVTKEMQTYLKAKARSFKVDKTAQDLEKEAEVVQARYEKILKGKLDQLKDVQAKIKQTRRDNAELDRKICSMNVDRCELELQRDVIGEARQREDVELMMKMIRERADLIRNIQDNYAEHLVLQTEHELLRLRRFPVLQPLKTFHDYQDKKDISE